MVLTTIIYSKASVGELHCVCFFISGFMTSILPQWMEPWNNISEVYFSYYPYKKSFVSKMISSKTTDFTFIEMNISPFLDSKS